MSDPHVVTSAFVDEIHTHCAGFRITLSKRLLHEICVKHFDVFHWKRLAGKGKIPETIHVQVSVLCSNRRARFDPLENSDGINRSKNADNARLVLKRRLLPLYTTPVIAKAIPSRVALPFHVSDVWCCGDCTTCACDTWDVTHESRCNSHCRDVWRSVAASAQGTAGCH